LVTKHNTANNKTACKYNMNIFPSRRLKQMGMCGRNIQSQKIETEAKVTQIVPTSEICFRNRRKYIDTEVEHTQENRNN
jgi:hypothetical protein